MSNKFEDFLDFCSSSTDPAKFDTVINKQFELIQNSDQLSLSKKKELVTKILDAVSNNPNEDIKNLAHERYKEIFKPVEGEQREGKKIASGDRQKEFHETRYEEEKIREHVQDKISDVKKLPSKPFILIYEEMEKQLPDKVFSEKSDDDIPAGKIKLKVKSTGKIDLYEENIAKVLLQQGAAVVFKEEKQVKEEEFEEKWQRFYNKAESWKNEAMSGNLHSLELVVSLMVNKFPITRDSAVHKSKAAVDVLIEYEKEDLPYLLVKLLTKEHRLKAADPKNIGQQSKADALRTPFESNVKDLLIKRIPAVFRKKLVSAYEQKLISKSRLFAVQTELSALTRPAVSDYKVDQDLLNDLEDKKSTLEKEVSQSEYEMDSIDQQVRKEMASIEEIGKELPGNKMMIKDILNLYEENYFKRKQEYLDSKRAEGSKKEGYFSSASDVRDHYKNVFKNEKIQEEMAPENIKETAEKMIENLSKFIKDPKMRFDFFMEIYGAVQQDIAATAIIDSIGKLSEIKDMLATMKSFDETAYQKFIEEITMFLYNTIKEGTGLVRVHSYSVIAKIGRLQQFEVEKLWYEDWLRAFKYEADALKNDPFLDDVVDAYLTGANRLEAMGTKLYKMKKNALHTELLKQVQLAKEKNNAMLISFYTKMAAVI